MTSTNHPLFQQPYKYINLFGQVQPRVVQFLIFISSQSCSERKCGHVERDYESLVMFRSLCANCMKKYLEENEAKDWLKCPMCHQRFHEKCLELYPLYDFTVNNNNSTWKALNCRTGEYNFFIFGIF